MSIQIIPAPVEMDVGIISNQYEVRNCHNIETDEETGEIYTTQLDMETKVDLGEIIGVTIAGITHCYYMRELVMYILRKQFDRDIEIRDPYSGEPYQSHTIDRIFGLFKNVYFSDANNQQIFIGDKFRYVGVPRVINGELIDRHSYGEVIFIHGPTLNMLQTQGVTQVVIDEVDVVDVPVTEYSINEENPLDISVSCRLFALGNLVNLDPSDIVVVAEDDEDEIEFEEEEDVDQESDDY